MDKPASVCAAPRARPAASSVLAPADERPGVGAAGSATASAIQARSLGESRTLLRETLTGRPQEVRHALMRIASALSGQGLSVEDCIRAEVVLAEILNNIVEHAYCCHRPGRLVVQIVPEDGVMVVSVEDDGAPMPEQTLPSGEPQNLAVDLHDLPEGGFGWFLIRELAEDLKYERRDGRNRLTFTLPISAHP